MRAMLVEDDPGQRELLRELLTQRGHVVATFGETSLDLEAVLRRDALDRRPVRRPVGAPEAATTA